MVCWERQRELAPHFDLSHAARWHSQCYAIAAILVTLPHQHHIHALRQALEHGRGLFRQSLRARESQRGQPERAQAWQLLRRDTHSAQEFAVVCVHWDAVLRDGEYLQILERLEHLRQIANLIGAQAEIVKLVQRQPESLEPGQGGKQSLVDRAPAQWTPSAYEVAR